MGLVPAFENKLKGWCGIAQQTGLGKPKLGFRVQFRVQLGQASRCHAGHAQSFTSLGIIHGRQNWLWSLKCLSVQAFGGFYSTFSPHHKIPGEQKVGLTTTIFLKDTSFTNNRPLDDNFNFPQRAPWLWLAINTFPPAFQTPILF